MYTCILTSSWGVDLASSRGQVSSNPVLKQLCTLVQGVEFPAARSKLAQRPLLATSCKVGSSTMMSLVLSLDVGG